MATKMERRQNKLGQWERRYLLITDDGTCYVVAHKDGYEDGWELETEADLDRDAGFDHGE